MAKKFKRMLALVLVLVLCAAQMALPASADERDDWNGGWGNGGWNGGWGNGGNNNQNLYEWYQVYVQGNLVSSGQGRNGDVYYLGTHYDAGASVSGSTLNWYIHPHGGSHGNFGGSVDLNQFITIPDGFEVGNIQIEQSSIDGVNDPYVDMYDNAVITITIKTFFNPVTGEEIPVVPTEPEPTEPPASEPPAPPVDYAPALTVVKTSDKEVYTEGETITWTVTVINVSEYAAYDVTVTDPLTGDSWTLAALQAGASQAYETTSVAKVGTVLNVAIASWTDGDEIPDDEESDEPKSASGEKTVTVEKPEPVNYTPVLTLVKTSDKDTYQEGSRINWNVIVTNTSRDTAYNVRITDPFTGDSWTVDVLEAGASKTFATHSDAKKAGSVTNNVTATWTDGDEIPDAQEKEVKSATASKTVTVSKAPAPPADYEPVLTLTKTADKEVYTQGEQVIWTVTVTNNSPYTARNITVTDPLTGDSWSITALAPGANKFFETTSTANAPGQLTNKVTAAWTDGDQIPDKNETDEVKSAEASETVTVEKPAPENYIPVLTLTKTADKDSYVKGDRVFWSVVVTNIGEHAAHNVRITDPLTGDSWTVDVLEAGEYKVFTTHSDVNNVGSVTNTANVTWTDGDQIPDDEEEEVKSAEASETVTVSEPEPEPTEPPAPEVEPTEPPAPEVEPTEPPAPEVEPTEPPVPEVEPTEPPVPEVEPTEPPVPEVEPEVEPEAEPEVEPEAEPEVTPDPQPDNNGVLVLDDDYLIIPDDDVPLADVPKTGSNAVLWIIPAVFSAAGLLLTKKKDDEE